jgi:type V secretory pathway adhesin AidA
MLITTSSGVNQTACAFKIESIGTIQPGSIAVTMTASGITPAQATAKKFAIDRHSGALVHFQTTSQTVYAFTGSQLPATVDPAVVWGANAGQPLDNSDLGATFVVTYTVVAQSLEGVTATPTVAPTKTPFQSFLGATGAPVNALTPPPTSAARNSSSGGSTPLFALLICLILAGFALAATEFRRRSVRR